MEPTLLSHNGGLTRKTSLHKPCLKVKGDPSEEAPHPQEGGEPSYTHTSLLPNYVWKVLKTAVSSAILTESATPWMWLESVWCKCALHHRPTFFWSSLVKREPAWLNPQMDKFRWNHHTKPACANISAFPIFSGHLAAWFVDPFKWSENNDKVNGSNTRLRQAQGTPEIRRRYEQHSVVLGPVQDPWWPGGGTEMWEGPPHHSQQASANSSFFTTLMQL